MPCDDEPGIYATSNVKWWRMGSCDLCLHHWQYIGSIRGNSCSYPIKELVERLGSMVSSASVERTFSIAMNVLLPDECPLTDNICFK